MIVAADSSQWLSTGKAARLCSVQPDTILKWIKKGRLQAVRTAGGHYRIDQGQVERLKVRQDVPARAPQAEECSVSPVRCWEYLSDRGSVREECKNCIVYRIRATWCFQVAQMESEIGHARRFCQNSCEDCAYYRRVTGLATNVLLVTADQELLGRLAGSQSDRIALRFARNAYEASATIQSFRPAFVVIDEELPGAIEAELVDSLLRDPRVPGLKIILCVPRGMARRSAPCRRRDVLASIEKPFSLDGIAAVIDSLPVESLAS